MYAQFADALKGVWPSLPGGSQANTSMMQLTRRAIDTRAAYGPQARQTQPQGVPQTSIVPGAYTPDPAFRGGAAPAAMRSSVSNDNSRTNTSSVETNINGQIVVNTAATDADGIARGIGKSLQRYSYVSQANTGIS
jgi:hypothetical protein